MRASLAMAVGVLLAVVAGACSSTQLPDIEQSSPTTTSDEPAPTTTVGPSTPTSPATPPTLPVDDLDLPARLATLGPAGELLVRSADGSWEQWSEPDTLVSQFSWSPDGTQLTWTELTADGSSLIVGDGQERTELDTTHAPFYLLWTPAGDEVSHLGQAEDQIALTVSSDGASPVAVAEASSLYYSWSPEGRLVTHEGGSDLNLIDAGEPELVAQTSAAFQAPVWLDENRVVAVVDLERGDALAIVDVDDKSVTPLFEIDGNITFTVSPDRTRLAYQIQADAGVDDRPVSDVPAQTDEPDPDDTPDVLVLDLETTELTLAFVGQALWLDWSPDSTSLAALISAPELTWRLWDENELTRTESVEISPVMLQNFVPFFDQYSQSLTGWSPQSDQYAFAASLAGRTGVFVQDASVGGDVSFLGPGVMVAWSQPAPTEPE
ncbi:MAG: hypothetical protein ACR2QE_13400 [Acidimicrobiales bacterium]